MSMAAFIAGDWGTTNLRLLLADRGGNELASTTGPGVALARDRFETVLAELIAPWVQSHGPLPVMLCGMIGSTIGWANAPYVPCPALPTRIAESMVGVRESVFIAPGLSCRNRHGAPDVMRGEETQILGALRLDPRLRHGRHLLCLPGTHAKWAVLHDGRIEEFLTAVTGELFAVLNEHSVLVRAGDAASSFSESAFESGLQRVLQTPHAALAHLLFECRSRQLLGDLSRDHAPDFLSGLLIAHDVRAALILFPDIAGDLGPVTIIASSALAHRYERVLRALRVRTATVDGTRASLAGLTSLYSIRYETGAAHAD